MTLSGDNQKRFIAVLNRKIEIGKLLNALGHMTAGLAGGGFVTQDAMRFLTYQDQDGGVHPTISHYPFIVCQAENSNQIRTLRNAVKERSVPFTDFTSTMTVGTSQEQLDATARTPESALEYYGICLFGETDVLRELTKKFSLFRYP